VELALEERVSLLYLLWRAEQRRKRRPRRTWVHQVLETRDQFGEFHHLLQELRLDDGRFQRYHRLSLGQFEDLLSRVGPRIARLDTNYRRSIPPAERLSICLRFLATGDSFRTIAFSFRVGVSTVSQIIPQVATAIWDCLVDDFMAVPSTQDWRSLSAVELWMGSTSRRRHPPTQDPCSTTTRELFPLFSLRLWMQSIASASLMLGGTGGPATVVSWPTPPLVRLFGLGLSICLQTSLYLVENT
uniref:Transposase Helix-turn-helix domain-containing protein n=1 Tax=Astatotilapia calliptera TaxID=8154 RepID=A0AAX7V7Q6_ASTCA